MPEIIASTYEIIQRIGSGGGGVVYLANHLRLNKQVVLKADKRKITTRPELLRREVDVLKDLSHPYIPQVYDFFAEGDIVYTVMDFVDGESLDKALKRGDRFPQAQVITWARQLLEALEYLHSPIHGDPPKGYVHSDIKPANLMRRMNGNICLIDFNISLALGEENIIGASPGYASPEHYGLDFSFSGTTATQEDRTADMRGDTVTLTMPAPQTASPRKTIIPDVRSDIYSTGATLYHLLSGQRPDKDATQVTPLSGPGISPQVAGIIAKAMNPNPDLRYQSAAEMRQALDGLYENDPRARKLKRRVRTAAVVLSALFLAGGVSAFAGLRQMEQAQQAARLEAERTAAAEQEAKLALELIRSSQEAYARGDMDTARDTALAALEKQTQYDPMAQSALTDALGVYDLTSGFKAAHAVTLSSEVIKQTLSPDGAWAAVLTSGQVNLIRLSTGQVTARLPAQDSARSDMAFTDRDTLIYAGTEGITAYSVSENRALWSTGEQAAEFAVSKDGTTVAAVRPDSTGAVLYNGADGSVKGSVSFGTLRRKLPPNDTFADPMDDILALDAGGRWLAVSFAQGELRLFDTADPDGDIILFEQSDYTSFQGGFFERYFGCVAYDGAVSDFVAVDLAAVEVAGTMSGTGEVRMQVCEDGFCLAESNVLVCLDVDSGEQTELAFTQAGMRSFSHIEGRTLVRGLDGALLFYDGNAVQFDRVENIPCDFADLSGEFAVLSGRDSPAVRILRLEDHDEQKIGSYDGDYFHEETRLSRDRTTVMLYSIYGLRVYSMDGALLSEVSFPEPDLIYNQEYLRDGDRDVLEVTYHDGKRCRYAPEDGALLSEEMGEQPDGSLRQEYRTDRYIIDVPLHGTPVVRDAESGEQIKTLESEDFLTYAVQVGGGIMTEYFNTSGERYGILLNEQCEAIAYLPELYDVLPDGTLVFDDMRGVLRQSRIYSTQELISLGYKD